MSDPFRQQQRALTEQECLALQTLKDLALDLKQVIDLVPAIEPAKPTGAARGNDRARCLAIARTKLEEAVMWATKGITA